ncbi:DUF2062 domain-containing protein [Natranaerofaba carboxydovora]|uniref:DUF2062 domain-containing protein n=1 Tax=Natranaerofaba carboxydovora TaxID=2742683 RepID=UPI001F13D422|nr:DUF2062 domain-containing protein [Natranaerofaba carboxydovora]UMZ72600.1 hypothetical protein ACONDI_00124 [Natranaerofaba carboxydovora]
MVNRINDLKNRIINIMSMTATPQKIAIAAAIAVFWNFIPSLGVGPILTFMAAKLLKGNVVAAVTLNIGTGFFIPLFYTLNLITGRAITGRSANNNASSPGEGEYVDLDTFSIDRIRELFEAPKGVILDTVQTLSYDFVIGSVINAFVAGGFLYILFLFILKRREANKKQNMDG